MPSKTFTTGRIRHADYEPASRQLDLRWDNGSVLAYKHVPEEVFRRLCSAPNPTTYWEDRIAEEYPKGTPRHAPGREGGKTLKDLFGGDGGNDGDACGDAGACGDGGGGGGDGGGSGD